MNNLERHRNDLKALIELGLQMETKVTRIHTKAPSASDGACAASTIQGALQAVYQNWYTESCAVLRQILPERLDEFSACYLSDPKRKELGIRTYTIQDLLLGVGSATNTRTGEKYFDDAGAVRSRLSTQIAILKSAERRFESSLFDIQQLLRADLFDSELEAASELHKHNFLRAAGAVAGVVLEKHLGAVCTARKLPIKKTHPTISTFNDALKEAAVIDIPAWRFNQHLGDLRNLCDHGKGREPTETEIGELIDGVRKISKSIF